MRPRALLVTLGLLVASGADLLAEEGPWAGPRTERVPTRDGRSLAADVWLPRGEGPWPAILVQTPYGRTRVRPASVVDGADYAVVVVDWRGFFGSRDGGSPLAGARERGRDGYDAVEWTAAQAWCTGKVGTWGPSALGGQQFRTAKERPPHLACAVPIVSGLAWRYETFHPGGVLREEYADLLGRIGFRGMPETIRAHPLEDAVWGLAGASVRAEDVDVPCLLVGGWFDLHPGEMCEDFRALVDRGGAAARAHHRLLMGPWTHHFVGSYAEDARDLPWPETLAVAREEVRRWFDRWLRGRDPGPSPRVRWYVPGEEAWRTADAWPPPSSPRPLAFGRAPAGGTLLPPGPPAPEGRDAIRHDPGDPVPTVGGGNLDPRLASGPRDQRLAVLARPDVLSYLTPALEEPLALAGRTEVRLVVVVAGADADVHVRLCDVGPDGRALLVADGARRLSLRESYRTRSPVPQGEPLAVRVDLPDVAWTLAAGHRLLVAVSLSNAPRYEVSPAPATVHVVHGGAGGSQVVLPVQVP